MRLTAVGENRGLPGANRATAMASAVLRAEKEELLPIVDLILFCCVFCVVPALSWQGCVKSVCLHLPGYLSVLPG
jgi:hypothetical protein